MITHIQGRLVEKNPTFVIIDCQGVGYYIHITINTYQKIKDQEQLKLFTHLIIREDAHILYGFIESIEREMFRLLLNVNGVGATTARMILSTLTVQEFQEALLTDNVKVLNAVKGIGLKSAQKILLELKDKITKINNLSTLTPSINTNIKEEALNALEVLGFSAKQVTPIMERFLRETPTLSVEELIKYTLKTI